MMLKEYEPSERLLQERVLELGLPITNSNVIKMGYLGWPRKGEIRFVSQVAGAIQTCPDILPDPPDSEVVKGCQKRNVIVPLGRGIKKIGTGNHFNSAVCQNNGSLTAPGRRGFFRSGL